MGWGERLFNLAFWGFVPALVALRLIGLDAPGFEPVEGCRVTGVIDGDTVERACRGKSGVRARLAGYDAPDLFSPLCVSDMPARSRRHSTCATRSGARKGSR